jgi:hypothetical protein
MIVFDDWIGVVVVVVVIGCRNFLVGDCKIVHVHVDALMVG